MIVLHKVGRNSRQLFKLRGIVTLEEESPVVAKHLGFNNQYIGYCSRMDLHNQKIFSFNKRKRYCPYAFFFKGWAS